MSKSPIGVNLPIQIGKSGYFDQSFDDATVAKNSLKMLLNTRRGERRMNPEFGSLVWEYIFENITDSSPDIMEDIIKKDVGTWLPEIIIKSIDIIKKEENIDTYTLQFKITFQANKYDKSIQILNIIANINST